MDNANIPSLKSLEGTKVLMSLPLLYQANECLDMTPVTLWRVEEHGVWIESQRAIERLLSITGHTGAPRTPVIFVPWASIGGILGSQEVPMVSDKATLQ